MSTLRYVGARYVPKWYVNSVNQSSEWEVNVEYEPLTWVTTQNNHLYLSKKTVPDNIGTPAQNTAYWLDMGQMTGDLQNIQDEIDAIVANMGDLNDLTTTDKNSLVAAINEAAGSGGGNNYNPIHSYYWIIIGDSYTMYPTEGTSWADLLIAKMGLSSSEYTLLRVNGGGFGNNLFASALSSAVITTTKPVKIVICGGFNDGTYITQSHTFSELSTAIEAFYTAAITRFTDCKIYLGFIAYEKNSIGVTRRNKEALYSAMLAYKRASRYGMIYLTNVEHCLRAFSLLDSTGFHPNASGAELIYEAVYNAVMNGSAPIIPMNIDLTSYINFGGTRQRGEVRAIRNNGVCTLEVKNLFVTGTSIPITDTTAVMFTSDDDHGLFSGSSNCRGTLRGSVIINNVVETEPGITCVYNQNRLTAISSHNGTITGYILDGSLTFGSDTFDSNEIY